ncbi:hypothetical protein NDU88_003829 [Pleurodeles waltl]|uniref:Uncharacterized protein n=1 Tax=Pleurodeles waltl TaxID=8319 RepID=A0AAV7W392_PLEWA|nr:hypothetical protein NDU88_003829 [Pleurodeles waltl]
MPNCRLSTEGGRVGSHEQELAKTAPQSGQGADRGADGEEARKLREAAPERCRGLKLEGAAFLYGCLEKMQSSPQPSPDRRLSETRGGSSTPPGLGASNSSSALLDPGTYGPTQGGEIPGSPCCHPRTERTGAPETVSLKPSPPSGRVWGKGLYLIAPRCSAASGAFAGQMDGGCVRMSHPGRIPDVRLLQVRTLPHAPSAAIRSCRRRRRPGSPSGALLH